jgi:hypothetical protein
MMMIKVRKSKAMRELPEVPAGAEGAGGVSTRPNSDDDTDVDDDDDDFLADRPTLDENIDDEADVADEEGDEADIV